MTRQLDPGHGRQRPALGQIQQRVLARTLMPQRVVGVVQRRTRKPLCTGHGPLAEHARRGRRELDAAELRDRAPEGLEIGDRPPPERLVVVELATTVGEPAQVARQMRARKARRRRSPEQGAFFNLHSETEIVMGCGPTQSIECAHGADSSRHVGRFVLVAGAAARSVSRALQPRSPSPSSPNSTAIIHPIATEYSMRRSRRRTRPAPTSSSSSCARQEACSTRPVTSSRD